MLPRADSVGSRPLAYVEAPAPVGSSTDARQEVYHRLNQIALGQQVPAKVLERLADGTFLVRVADASARMSLPVGAKVGDDLAMTLVERQPRPTFLLGAGAGAEPATGDARATLSQAARLIDSLLQSAQQNGGATAAIGRTPLLPSAGAGAAQLAGALQDAADASGLFYESHLAHWAAGSRPLAAILREPQAAQANAAAPDGGTGTEAALLRHLAGQWLGNGRSLAELAAELQARTGNALQSGLDAALNSQTAQLVHAQLNALETQRFVWQGELWPGQKLEWEVERDAQGDQRGEQEQQDAWQSAVRFELPSLGSVSATLHLQGDRISILVRTGSADSATLLRAHGAELAQALDAAGSPLEALIVNQDEQA